MGIEADAVPRVAGPTANRMRTMAQVPIVFLGGMSGSGKTTLAGGVESDMGFLHLNIDLEGSDGIDVSGLRNEWDSFMHEGDARPLADLLRRKVQNARAAGAVLSEHRGFSSSPGGRRV
jgi:hypothetical protein